MRSFCVYTDPQLHIHHQLDEHPRDSYFYMHVHEEYELLYFVSGNASYLIEGTEYPLEPGYLLLTRPTESHKLKVLGDQPYERYALSFSADLLDVVDPQHHLLEPFLNHPLGQYNLYLPAEFQGADPQELFEAMCAAAENDELRRLEILTHLFPLLNAIRHAFLRKNQLLPDSTPEKPAEKIVRYINRHLFEELSLESLASHFYLSTSQLSRLFRKATGSTVWDYITIKRLLAARSRIRMGVSPTEACQACGFRDYSAFYRAYVARFGNPPKKDKLLV